MSFSSTLPVEITWRILYYTNLVVPRKPVGHAQGIHIVDGRIHSHGIWKNQKFYAENPFPRELFFVSRDISSLARQITFSENRFTLEGQSSYGLDWLDTQPEDLVRRIRDLDIRVPLWWSFKPGEHSLTKCLASLGRAQLDQLTLSIDGAFDYDSLQQETLDYEWLIDLYKPFVNDLQAGNLQSLRAFFVFWPKYRELEIEAEKAVMGDDYDSSMKGKIEYLDRDWRLPHGWEWTIEEDEVHNHSDLEYEAWFYHQRYMDDDG